MKIKRIELIGFKSFADRTVIALHGGDTCIVGPNGCGKSNIVDAFRWVLGEQSAKSLRGERMEEVIFNGTTSKKQKGMAEVSLVVSMTASPGKRATIQNGSDAAAEDDTSDEVSISRRLFRSGESEYLINRRQCRLKDIRDIFLDTGLDAKSYSILDQGKIGDILNTKPQDRRFLIEEVAGVMKYKVRKAEAISKLETSKQNLQRINDIVVEVKRQMNSLDRQVKKAERYKRLISELRDIETRIAKRDHQRLSAEFLVLTAKMERLREIESAKRAELSMTENNLEKGRIDVVVQEKALAGLEQNLTERERALTEAEKRIAVIKANRENKRAEIDRLAALEAELQGKQEEGIRRLVEIEKAEHTLTATVESIAEEARDKQLRLDEIESAVSTSEASLERRRRDLFSLSETLSSTRNEFHKIQSALDTLKYRESVSVKDVDAVRAGIGDLERSMSGLRVTITNIEDSLTGLEDEREQLRSAISALEEEIEHNRSFLAKEREDLAGQVSRLASLREMIVDQTLSDFLSGEKGGSPVRRVVLSDIINAQSDFEVAVEAALAEQINSLIVDNREDLISVIRLISDKQIGRTAILFTPFSKVHHLGSDKQPPTRDGIVGRGSDVAKCEDREGLTGLTQSMLERLLITKDLETALALRSDPALDGVTLVTREGIVLTDQGFVYAGQGKEILRRKREIRELKGAVEQAQAGLGKIEGQIADLSADLAFRREAVEAVETAIVDHEKELSLTRHTLMTRQEEFERKTRRNDLLHAEITSIGQETSSLLGQADALTAAVSRLEAEKERITAEIEQLNASLAESKRQHDDARSHITELRLSLAAYREKADALRNERDGLATSLDETGAKKALAADEKLAAERAIATLTAELTAIEEEIKGAIIETERIRDQWVSGKEAMHAAQQELLAAEQSLKQTRIELDALGQEITEIHGKLVECRLRLENTLEGVRHKYGIDIAAEEIDTTVAGEAEDSDRMTGLQDKIRDLGPVNLGTIEEYDDLKSRHDFLSKQQQDLTISIAELEEAISRINSTTKRKLREAYDALRSKFLEVFTALFGGGRADILLTDEEDILEAGIEVIAQPPGKKLQNLNLLSGGEKALTSLALLFAGFLIKPSPLCILDEVDAALDESNTVRFAEMIRGLAADTQFIIVTHNRATMEVADYLYGITMEEAGVSKVISLQFSEVEDIVYA